MSCGAIDITTINSINRAVTTLIQTVVAFRVTRVWHHTPYTILYPPYGCDENDAIKLKGHFSACGMRRINGLDYCRGVSLSFYSNVPVPTTRECFSAQPVLLPVEGLKGIRNLY